jgi:hypothetical protein
LRFTCPSEYYTRRLYHAHWLHDPASAFCFSAWSLAVFQSPTWGFLQSFLPPVDLAPLRSLPTAGTDSSPLLRFCVGASRVRVPLAHAVPLVVSPRIPPRSLTSSGFGYLSGCCRSTSPSLCPLAPYRHFPAGNASGISDFSGFPRGAAASRYRVASTLLLFLRLSRFSPL